METQCIILCIPILLFLIEINRKKTSKGNKDRNYVVIYRLQVVISSLVKYVTTQDTYAITNKKYILKIYLAVFQLWNLFLYVLLFVTQDHPSCESIIGTVIMQAVTSHIVLLF